MIVDLAELGPQLTTSTTTLLNEFGGENEALNLHRMRFIVDLGISPKC